MALSHVSAAARPGPDWAEQDSWSYHDLEQAPLSGECRDELETLRALASGRQPAGGWPPGWPAPPSDVRNVLFQCLFRAALARGEGRYGWFVWQDLDSELGIHHRESRTALLEGVVLVGLRTQCDQISGSDAEQVELVVPMAVGTPQAPAGLVVAAETTARGPQLLVDVWGETAVAASWQALIAVCRYVASLAGEDQHCRPLVPGAVHASDGVLTVVPQALHAIDPPRRR
ncbi:hypothetical protein AB0B50_03425 [Streptomyces sp. NPDC041068]|uniref:hypothetical protein n=1 Tax=Streptomyces sp. NPDC041068 TaxID=3155130 RepID=UPI0033D75E5D